MVSGAELFSFSSSSFRIEWKQSAADKKSVIRLWDQPSSFSFSSPQRQQPSSTRSWGRQKKLRKAETNQLDYLIEFD